MNAAINSEAFHAKLETIIIHVRTMVRLSHSHWSRPAGKSSANKVLISDSLTSGIASALSSALLASDNLLGDAISAALAVAASEVLSRARNDV